MDRNEAIKVVKSHYPANKQMLNEALEFLIPELKESEDERISKEIIKYLERTVPHHHRDEVLKSKEWTAWLEKQELKSNPYSGVSFSYNGNIWGMCARDNGVEILFDGELKAFLSSEKSFIYPTRPQPVLEPIKEEKVGNNNKVESKFKVGDWVVSPNGVYWHIDAIQNGRYEVTTDTGQCGNWPLDTNIYRLWTIQDAKDGDVLFMDNGSANCIFIYKSSNNGIINKYASYNNFGFEGEHYLVLNDGYVIPATKEQRDLLFQKMKEAGYEWDAEKKELKKVDAELTDFEKSLKHIMIETLECGDTRNLKADAEMLLRFAQKPAWSEEDECYMGECIGAIATKDGWSFEEKRKTKHWLKSMKERYTWKPSDEQMKFLQKCIEAYNEVTFPTEVRVLSSLYNDLKKLK